jgi:hypothetical protein
MNHIIRIGPAWLRLPLLCLAWPLALMAYVLRSLRPVRMGGHPNKRRLLCADFYTFPISLFWAAWDGHFVPDDRPENTPA